MRCTARAQRGLALLEVLVAFVIAAAALTVLFSGVLDGMRGAAAASRTEMALSHARSRLAALGHGHDIVASEQTGDDGGGYHYRLIVAPVAAAGAEATLYAIRLTLTWEEAGHAHSLVLDTQRLAGPGAAPP